MKEKVTEIEYDVSASQLAIVYARLGEHEMVETLLKKAADNTGTWEGLVGLAFMERGDEKMGMSYLHKSLKTASNATQNISYLTDSALPQKVSALCKLGKKKLARELMETYANLITITDTNKAIYSSAYYDLGDMKKYRELGYSMSQVDPSTDINLLVHLGKYALLQKEYQKYDRPLYKAIIAGQVYYAMNTYYVNWRE